MSIKITDDNFVWNVINNEYVNELFKLGYPLYVLYPDGSESLIDNETILNSVIHRYDIAMEVGFVENDFVEDKVYYTYDAVFRNSLPTNKDDISISVNVYVMDKSYNMVLIRGFVTKLDNDKNIEELIRKKLNKNNNYKLIKL
jgi:hypothetical protein